MWFFVESRSVQRASGIDQGGKHRGAHTLISVYALLNRRVSTASLHILEREVPLRKKNAIFFPFYCLVAGMLNENDKCTQTAPWLSTGRHKRLIYFEKWHSCAVRIKQQKLTFKWADGNERNLHTKAGACMASLVLHLQNVSLLSFQPVPFSLPRISGYFTFSSTSFIFRCAFFLSVSPTVVFSSFSSRRKIQHGGKKIWSGQSKGEMERWSF